MAGLVVLNKDGKERWVTDTHGITARSQQSVMIESGYVRSVKKGITLPPGQFALLTLTIPPNVKHAGLGRVLSVYNSPCIAAIVPNYEGTLPVTDEPLTAWNQAGPKIDPDVLSVISFRGVHASNPIDLSPDVNNSVDYGVLRATSAQGVRSATTETSSAVVGRQYEQGTHVAWIQNIGIENAEIEYSYVWYEYEL